MGRVHDARCAIDHSTEIVAVAPLDHPGVETAAHAKLQSIACVRSLQRDLEIHCRRKRIERILEHRVDSITSGLHDDTMVAKDRVTQDTVVVLERPLHLLRVLFPQPAAALDVGEEEGRDGGLVVHGRQVGGGMPRERQRLHSGRTNGAEARMAQRKRPPGSIGE